MILLVRVVSVQYICDFVGQGRFCTILRSYSRGAQGILLVYDITNKWSFDGIERWLNEVNEHAPGVPKILIGNRLHLAFNRQVSVSYALIITGSFISDKIIWKKQTASNSSY